VAEGEEKEGEGMNMEKKFTPGDFREELMGVLPGHKWTVHRQRRPSTH